MEQRPELPGVILAGKSISVISRAKMFERLGHQYGVELFLRKPISELQQALKSGAFLVPAQTRIEETVQLALSRPASEVYDPIVITDKEQHGLRMVDMHVLLLAQSRLMSNVANILGKLEQLEKLVLARASAEEMVLSALELLSQLVPYHQAAVLMQKDDQMEYVARRGVGWGGGRSGAAGNIRTSRIYQMMVETRQAVCVSDVNTVQDWEHFSDIPNLRSWLGVPLIGNTNLAGLLSLGRLTHSPFSKVEKDIAQVFAGRLAHSMEDQRNRGLPAARGN